MAVTGRGAWPLQSSRLARASGAGFSALAPSGALLADYLFAEGPSDPATGLPVMARIAELRLAVAAPTDDAERPLTRSAPFAAAYRELWRGEALFAGLSHGDARQLAAALEALDGRVSALRLGLAAFSQAPAHTGTLAAAPALGADTITLNLNPASGILRAGTLLTVGDIDTPTFQLFEVLTDETASGATVVSIAPRVRRQFMIGAPVAIGNVSAKCRLAGDELDVSVLVTHGLATITFVEAL